MNLETKRLSLDALRAETDRHQGNAADPLAAAAAEGFYAPG